MEGDGRGSVLEPGISDRNGSYGPSPCNLKATLPVVVPHSEPKACSQPQVAILEPGKQGELNRKGHLLPSLMIWVWSQNPKEKVGERKLSPPSCLYVPHSHIIHVCIYRCTHVHTLGRINKMLFFPSWWKGLYLISGSLQLWPHLHLTLFWGHRLLVWPHFLQQSTARGCRHV